jgi:hypothetical protein
MFQANNRDHN